MGLFFRQKKEPSLKSILFSSVQALSEDGADRPTGLRALAGTLNGMNADPETVRAIARDEVYRGAESADAMAEQLMGLLAAYGYGPGEVTAIQPDRVRESIAEVREEHAPELAEENLLLELVSGHAYAGAIVADAGTGATTLLKALVGAWCKQSRSAKPELHIADMRGGQSWDGLERISNVVINIPARDPKFLETAAQLFHEVAQEVQARAARFSIASRSPSMGSSTFPPMLLIVDGMNAVAEELSLLTNTQIQNHKHASALLKDFRYCLMSGPALNVSVMVSGDRLSNLSLSKQCLSNSRVIALGAVRGNGRGGYRAIDEILAAKDYIPATSDRARLRLLLDMAKQRKQPVALALSGLPRLGILNDFVDNRRDLGELYRFARAGL